MKKILLYLLLIVSGISYAQKYKTHIVKKGENVFRIAKRYNTTTEEIFKVNPTAKDGIKEGEPLAIPVVDNTEYKIHEVQEGDTVFSLAQKYETTTDAIYLMNPEAAKGINLGQVLKVGKREEDDQLTAIDKPSPEISNVIDSLKVQGPKIIRFMTHKVKKKETLFSLSKQYRITVEDIKKHNKRLYSEALKKKDKIRIPVYEKQSAITDPQSVKVVPSSSISGTTTYIIKPKDTRFGIARRHGITVEELERLNPDLDPDFPYGSTIVVPTSYYVPFDKNNVEEGFELYKVPLGETVFNILRKTDISVDSLYRMNPYIKKGLKEGMVIKIPKKDSLGTTGASASASTIVDQAKDSFISLEDKLYNFKPKKIALMLPFGLVDTLRVETRNEAEDFLQKKQSVRIALDLYKGVMMAIDSAKTKGISTEINVYDTQKNNNGNYIKDLIFQNNFDELDAVIGPLYQPNAIVAMEELKKYETPVFSPITRSKEGFQPYDNFFQTRPSDEMMQDRLIAFIKKDTTDKNIIIISQHGDRFAALKSKLEANFPEAKIAKTQEKNFVYEVDLDKVLDEKKSNWVILESKDVALISNVTTLLNAKVESHNITLFTTDKNKAFEDDSVKNEYLSKLHLHYPSIDKEFDNNTGKTSGFVRKYKKKYGVSPTKFVVRGFDIAYDVLLKLASADDVYHSVSVGGITEYVESRFNYVQQPIGGYNNQAIYLIKFDDDLLLTVIE